MAIDPGWATVTPRKHVRHQWAMTFDVNDPSASTWRCSTCGKARDLGLARRGRSSRNLGHRGERRSEKRYGWEKIGEAGGPDDLSGQLVVVQQKTTRRAPPLTWKQIFAALDNRAQGRTPLLLLSFVTPSVGTEDFIIIRGADWLALFGKEGKT